MFDRNKRKEVLDTTPVAIPAKFTRQSSYNETIRNIIRSEQLNRELDAAGLETFEEANDFEIGDDFEPKSIYEESFDPVDSAVLDRLTKDEYARKVEERFQQLEPLVNPKGKSNGKGSRRSDEGRRNVAGKRASSVGEVDEGEPKSSGKSADKVSVRTADNRDSESEE